MATAIVKSIGSAVGRNYATPQLFADAIPADLTVTDETWTGEIYNDSELNTYTKVSGNITDATRWIKITAAAGESFVDNPSASTNPLAYDPTKGVAITNTAGYKNTFEVSSSNVVIDRLQIKQAGSNGKTAYISTSAGGISKNLIIYTSKNSPAAYIRNGKLVNSLLVSEATSYQGITASSNSEFYNITLVSPSDITNTKIGILKSYSTPIAKNCAVFGFATAFNTGFSASSDYNACDDISAPGANSLLSKVFASQFEVVTTVGMDFRAKSGSDLDGAGTPDATNTLGLDIVGQTRSATLPTIGCWEVISSGGTTYFQTLQYVSLTNINQKKQVEKTFVSSSSTSSSIQKSSLFKRILLIASLGLATSKKLLSKSLFSISSNVSLLGTLKVLLRSIITTVGSNSSLNKNNIFSRLLTTTTTATLSLVKKIIKILSSSSAGSVALNRLKVFFRTLTATAITAPMLSSIKVLLKTLVTSVSTVPVLFKTLHKKIFASVSTLSALLKEVQKTLSVMVSYLSTLKGLKVFLKTLSSSASSLSNLKFSSVFSRLLLVSSGGNALIKKLISKVVFVASISVTKMIKFFTKDLLVFVGSAVKISKLKLIILKLISQSTGIVLNITRQISKTLTSLNSSIVLLQRKMFKVFSNISFINTSLVKEVKKTLTSISSIISSITSIYLGTVVVIRNIISKTIKFAKIIPKVTHFTRVKNNDTKF